MNASPYCHVAHSDSKEIVDMAPINLDDGPSLVQVLKKRKTSSGAAAI